MLVSVMHVTRVAVCVGQRFVVMRMTVGCRRIHAREVVVLVVFVVLVAVVVIE